MSKAIYTYIFESGVVRYGGQTIFNGKKGLTVHKDNRDIITSGTPPHVFNNLDERYTEIPVKHENLFTVNTNTQQFVDFNPARKEITIYNKGGETIYLAGNSSAGIASGIPLASGNVLEDIHSKDPWFAVCAGTGTMLVVETYS